ncbi:MAG: nucleotidyltransferase domain-containing protein [Nitrosomonadales bacterium]
MLTRETILETLRVLKPELVAKYKIRSIGLFGSYARGEQTTKSDVDVLVDVDPVIGLGFVDILAIEIICLVSISRRIRFLLPAEFRGFHFG